MMNVSWTQMWKDHDRVCISAVLVAMLQQVFWLWACVSSEPDHNLFYIRTADTTVYILPSD